MHTIQTGEREELELLFHISCTTGQDNTIPRLLEDLIENKELLFLNVEIEP